MKPRTQEYVLTLAQDSGADRDRSWSRIANLKDWERWLPDTSSITLFDNADPGRGTRFVVVGRRGVEHWQISYWNPGYRVVYQIEASSARSACAVELVQTDPSADLKLQVSSEVVLRGWRRLLSPLSTSLFNRNSAEFAAALHRELLRT